MIKLQWNLSKCLCDFYQSIWRRKKIESYQLPLSMIFNFNRLSVWIKEVSDTRKSKISEPWIFFIGSLEIVSVDISVVVSDVIQSVCWWIHQAEAKLCWRIFNLFVVQIFKGFSIITTLFGKRFSNKSVDEIHYWNIFISCRKRRRSRIPNTLLYLKLKYKWKLLLKLHR